MTFNISNRGVNNTEGTTAKFGHVGKVEIKGDFKNSGEVEIDIRANLNILGNLLNSGTFDIKDYITENKYKLIENAINDLEGDAKNYLKSSYDKLKQGNVPEANNWFGKFYSYIKQHPELMTSSVQILLQLFINK